MNKRMLDGSIWANEKFSDMHPMACLLQIGIINLADDQGRCKAHPLYLRSQIFPYRDVSVDDITTWLSHIVANGTAIIYQVDGKDYLQLVNWWQYQSHSFAAPSEYPRPDGWHDRIRYTGKNRTIYTCNWIVSSGDRLDDTCDEDGNPLVRPNKPSDTPPGQPLATPPSQPSGQATAPLKEAKDKDKEEVVVAPPPPAAKPSRTISDFAAAYEDVWGLPVSSKYLSDQICEWESRVTFEGWRYALQECADTRHVGNWKYLKRILERLEREGYRPKEKAMVEVPAVLDFSVEEIIA